MPPENDFNENTPAEDRNVIPLAAPDDASSLGGDDEDDPDGAESAQFRKIPELPEDAVLELLIDGLDEDERVPQMPTNEGLQAR